MREKRKDIRVTSTNDNKVISWGPGLAKVELGFREKMCYPS